MSPRSLPLPFASGLAETPGQPPAPLRDIWDRPVFRAPALPNPRVIFDPLPFRTQVSTAARRLARFAGR